MKYYKLFIIIIYILIFNKLYTYEKYVDFDLLKKASKPRFVNDGILITLPKNYGNTIYLRTSIDNWENDYYFKKSQYEIFYSFIPVKKSTVNINYRINVDGYWETDPYNKNIIEDYIGTKLSSINIPEEVKYYQQLPDIEKTDTYPKKVYFQYYNPEAEEVNLVCSIDNWSPYSNQMKKNKYGYWEITKYFSKGDYLYYFYVDGNKVLDLNNKKRVWDKFKEQVSFFTIK
ncbi:MAG: hypothetical protein JXB50_03260 [Spirochaetes bacterium]|nr:hypothetical protein [Spirochaetota bacterium]